MEINLLFYLSYQAAISSGYHASISSAQNA